jgi:osmoprotectant transport system permease protein
MTWLSTSWPRVLELTFSHLLLSLPAILLGIIVAVPLGRIASRWPRPGGIVLGAASLLYSIPALPLLIIIPFLFGFPQRSPMTLVVALGVYAAAVLVRTSADAFTSIDSKVRDSAVATGHSAGAMFWRVDLPLAVPVLVSGIRVVTVSTVGLVSISALIGVPSLGTLFTDGFQRGITAEVITGILVVIIVACLLDAICVIVGRKLTPWSHTRSHIKPALEPAGEARA